MKRIEFDRMYYCLLAMAKIIYIIGTFTLILPLLLLYLPISWYKPLEKVGNVINNICEYVIEM